MYLEERPFLCYLLPLTSYFVQVYLEERPLLCYLLPLASYFVQVYLEERGHELMDDDTTLLVIELNPSGVKYTPPGGGGGGCCSLQ